MNLFDKIKDAFSNEDEKAAAEAAAKEAADKAAADAQAAADSQAAVDAANAAAAAEQEARDRQEAADRIAAQEAAVKAAAEAEQAAAAQAAAEQAAAEQAAAAAATADNRPPISLYGLVDMVVHDSDASNPTGQAWNAEAGLIVERALASVVGDVGPVDGSLGTSFKAAYARWQESLGYSGSDADGIPGRASLEALAERTGAFRVTD